MSSADFQPKATPGASAPMQNNPTSNGQGAGGISNLTSGSAGSPSKKPAASAAATADGGGMFGAAAPEATETLGGRKAAGGDGAPPRKAMQLGKAKKLPNNLNLL